MAQAVSCRPLTAESTVRALVNPCGICDGQSGTGTGFLRVLRFSPANIIPPSFFILIYHLGDEQYVRYCQQFRDIVSPHHTMYNI
jgi:hypothetical protein